MGPFNNINNPLYTARTDGNGNILQGNSLVATIPLAGYATAQDTGILNNYGCKGIKVVLNVTNAGTGSITMNIRGYDLPSTTYYTILQGAAVTTNSVNIYTVYPGLTAVANVTANDVMPSLINVRVTTNNSNPITYSVGVYLIA